MFEPKGEKPMWEMIYDYVKVKPLGSLITLDELSDVIDKSILEYRAVIYRACKELMKVDQKFMLCVWGKGYRIVEGNDQLRHAETRHKKANKQIKMAKFEAVNLNTNTMSIDEKSRWQTFLAWNSMALSTMSSNTEQIAKVNVIASSANEVIGEQLKNLQSQMGSYAKQMEDLQKRIV